MASTEVFISSSPHYAGKISEQEWGRELLFTGRDCFIYHYDLMGRLSSVNHRITGLGQSTVGCYNEDFTYDLAGNILSHKANKDGADQQLCYTYNGNHIATVTHNDAAVGTAQYDSRGNITKIPGENLQIAYNLCNLPRYITTGTGVTVNYSYLSDGTKYRVVSGNGEKYLYAGSLRFWIDGNNNIVPESFAIAGGRVVCNNGNWMTNYYITDHLGSVRAVTDAQGNVLATFDYTPYGELLTATDSTATGTDHLFTGKEQQGKLGVGELYDSQARFMNTTGSFLSMDPLAEKYYHLSPYAYCAGDPVNLVDPDGRLYGDFVDNKGRIIGNDGIEDGNVYVLKINKWQFFRSYKVGSKHSWRSLRKAKKFVEMNSGNTEAFLNYQKIYDCFVKIVGDKNMRQDMVEIVSLDDGSGKYVENNRREHGGYIDGNEVVKMDSGELEDGDCASIYLPKGYPKFHSHVSVDVDKFGRYTGSYDQFPSPEDIDHAQDCTCYVFSTYYNKVYVYNGQGVLSIVPYENFVNFIKNE